MGMISLQEGVEYIAHLVAGHPSDAAVVIGKLVAESVDAIVLSYTDEDDDDNERDREFVIYKHAIRYLEAYTDDWEQV